MNWLWQALFAVCLQLLVLLPIVTVGANVEPKRVQQNATAAGSSPWLRNVANPRPRPGRCRFRPWICEQGEHPPTARMRCCRDQCVDVSSDDTHCGLCGIRCPFTWQCCRGVCINTNISPYNCGRCGNRCPWRVPCLYGMCGYAQPPPPWPFPRPPRPFPPHPPRPPRPFPPHPPHPPRPFPPHPPHPRRPLPEPCPPHPRPPPVPHPPCPRGPPSPLPPMTPNICPPGLPQPPEGDQPSSMS